MIVFDTATLLYWTLDRAHLSAPAAKAIAGADRILVSSISIWELGIKSQRGRLELPLSISEFAARLSDTERVQVLAVDEQIWIENIELEWEHRDPADRTIVATARHFGCPLVTPDARILAFYPSAIW
jgi:PIN domain nuclease of toxin-antitoxin system